MRTPEYPPTKSEFLSRVLAYYRDRIFRQRCVSCRASREEEKDEEREDDGIADRREEEDERHGKGKKEEGRGRNDMTPTMRRRYATEYHYPDNGPAISSVACINLRVKGQDTWYLNK